MRYYSLIKNSAKKEADLSIFGDITSYPFMESDISNYNLSKQLEEMKDVETINVHINSYGGEVAEGLAIYNSLKNHKAKVKTHCDGFACSIASVIFMAGDERIMNEASLLMIHNAWTFVQGNSKELRKAADDLETITQASINAYMSRVNITEEELRELMDSEHWLEYSEAMEKGFATGVEESKESDKASQSVRKTVAKMLLENQSVVKEEEQEEKKMVYECSECGYIHEGELPEFFVCPECGADKEKFIELDPETMKPIEAEGDEEEEPTEPETEPTEPETEEEEIEQAVTMYECSECGYIHEGDLPEYFICPECGADKDAFEEVEAEEPEEEPTEDTEAANQKAAEFFEKLIGGMN